MHSLHASRVLLFATLVAGFMYGCSDEPFYGDGVFDAVSLDTAEGDGSLSDVDSADTDDVSDSADAPGDSDAPDAGDAADTGGDTTTSERNACGGTLALDLDGISQPGESCGCGGVTACNGPDALRCIDEAPRDVCGGCSATGVPGQPCGECNTGTWACDGNEMACVGEQQRNLCGGCGILEGAPRSLCGSGSPPRLWACVGENEVACVATTVNACGGTGDLTFDGDPALPGDRCATECGAGTLRCDGGLGSLYCDAPQVNACGGCDALERSPGDACGCGNSGSLTCADDGESLRCEGDDRNVCGGCGRLTTPVGDACGDGGVYACVSADATACVSAATNACGGRDTLRAIPGTGCGACESGVYTCTTPDEVTCVGDLGADAFNDCGSCAGGATGRVGDACGACGAGRLGCDAGGAVMCVEADVSVNACGGCEALVATPGDACGTCAAWQCGNGALECKFDRLDPSCATLPVVCADLTCASDFRTCAEGSLGEDASCGACVSGYVERGGVCVLAECEFGETCAPTYSDWSSCDWESVCDQESGRERTRTDSLCVDGFCADGATVTEREACPSRSTDGTVCGSDGRCAAGACVALPSVPVDVSGSTTRPTDVLVTWAPVAGATYYEVSIDGGTWTRVAGTSFVDAAASAPSIAPCAPPGLSASQGTHAAFVRLRCDGAVGSAGAARSYRVRAGNPAGTSAPSAPSSGYRTPGALAITWARANAVSGPFSTLPGSSGAAFDDTTAPTDGGVRYYRATVAANGAAAVTSAIVSGYRTPPPGVPAGVVATQDRADNVVVSWPAVTDADAYEIQLDGGAWIDVGTNRVYVDSTSGAPTLEGCAGPGLYASRGLSPDHVELRCDARTVPGSARTYRVRSFRGGAASAPSAAATGFRNAGPLSYQWQASVSSGGPWADLAGGTTPTFNDVTAPDDGTPRWYRARQSAAGVSTVTSAAVEGFRNNGTLPLGAECAESASCLSGLFQDLRCTPPGFVYVPPGAFDMGSPLGELGRCGSGDTTGDCWEETQVVAGISRPVFVSTTEVTRQEWFAITGTSPSFSDTPPCPTCPVDSVSWYEAVLYANALSANQGLTQCYIATDCIETDLGSGCEGTSCTGATTCGTVTRDADCEGYRLPTDSEWEFIYRAGATTSLPNGALSDPVNDPLATAISWYGEPTGYARPVGTLAPTGNGIYDMAGNVWEWTEDAYATSDRIERWGFEDYVATSAGPSRTHRGGFWGSTAADLRAGARGSSVPTDRNFDRGLRLVRSAPTYECADLACDVLNRACASATECGDCLPGYEEGEGACWQIPAAVTLNEPEAGGLRFELSWTPADDTPVTHYTVAWNGAAAVNVGALPQAAFDGPGPTWGTGCSPSARWLPTGTLEVSCEGLAPNPGPPVSYAVRAWNGPVSSAPVTGTARHPVGVITYRWHYRSESAGSGIEFLTTLLPTAFASTPPFSSPTTVVDVHVYAEDIPTEVVFRAGVPTGTPP